jgi:probable rRNA maturation factor
MTDKAPLAPHRVLVSGIAATTAWVDEAERLLPMAIDSLIAAGLAPSSCEVSVTLIGNEEIRELNRKYRGKDAATDVLSFSQLEVDGAIPQTWPAGVPFPIGDIVISIPRMAEQASEYGHSEAREFGFLLVHGLLHLVGFDHETPDEAADMHQREEEVLAAAGLTRDAQTH